MADNELRNFRRDKPARAGSAEWRGEMSDPLAELARLIGQSDPPGAFGGEDSHPAEAYGEADASDCAEDDYAQTGDEAAEAYVPPTEPHRAYGSGAEVWPRAGRRDDAPSQYSPPLFGDADARDDHAEEDAEYGDEPPTAGGRGPGAYSPPSPSDDGDDADESYAEEYEEEYDGEPSAPARRSFTVVFVVLGLIVLGSAGAFGYRAMFGTSVFPALPPIIKPSGTPVKIVPSHEAQTSAQSQNVAAKNAGEHLVSHEEKPLDVQAAAPDQQGVTTIPVVSNTPPDGLLPPTQPLSASADAAPPTSAAQPGESLPDGFPAQAPPALPLSSGAKAIHTVAIHADQPTASSPRPTRPGRERDPATASAGPLSIVPSAESGAPERSGGHTAMARAEEPTAAQTPPAAGGYAVQVSSQRSEVEAQAAFRTLQAKYPQQLGNQHAMVRRADLGAKGIYYRALVGPFASAEEASRLCSSLKAAGGSCLIQRN